MIYFVCPDPQRFISGGNLFNLQIIEGLEVLGRPVCAIPAQDFKNLNTSPHDIILFDSIYLKEIPSLALYKTRGIKMVLIHLLPSMTDKTIEPKIEREWLAPFDFILANSGFTRDYLLQRHFSPDRIRVIQPWIGKTLPSTLLNRDKLIVVANWYPAKQIDLLLRQLTLHRLPDGLIIRFFGDTQVDPAYTRKCLSILDLAPGLKNHVSLEGQVPWKSLQKIFLETRCLVDVSGFESYGMAVAEAIVCGAAVLTLGNGQVRHWIGHGRCRGCNDIHELIGKLVLIHENKLQISPNPVIDIITEGPVFRQQLVEVFRSPSSDY